MKKALIIIDIQNDYFPGGTMELHKSTEAACNCKKVLDLFRKNKELIIYIQHIALKPGASFFLPGTKGAEIYEGVKPLEGEIILQKHFPNSFRETGLHDLLKKNGVTNLVFTSMMTHMCVDTTVRAAFDLGYTSTVLGDCCAAKKLTYKNETVEAEDVQCSYIAALNGTFASVINTEELCITTM